MADSRRTDGDDRDVFLAVLSSALRQIRVSIAEGGCDLLWAHYRAVVETNRVMNLTRLTCPEEAAVKHYADSLALVAWAEQMGLTSPAVLDVGTGAGFPAIPLAVARPAWKITAVDATGKKADFVRRIAHQLNLSNLRVEHRRVEHTRPTQRFDIVAARAVTRLDPLLRWLTPYVQNGGYVVAYKARPDAEELEAGRKLAKTLKLAALPDWSYTLTCEEEVLERILKIHQRRGNHG